MNLAFESKKLLYRPLEINDAEKLMSIKCHPNSIALKGYSNVSTISQIRFNIIKLIEEYNEYGIGRLAVLDKNGNNLIGWAGLRYNPDFFGNGVKSFYDFDFSFKNDYNNSEYLYESLNTFILELFNKSDVEVIYTKPVLKNDFEFEVYSKFNTKELDYNNITSFRITKL